MCYCYFKFSPFLYWLLCLHNIHTLTMNGIIDSIVAELCIDSIVAALPAAYREFFLNPLANNIQLFS